MRRPAPSRSHSAPAVVRLLAALRRRLARAAAAWDFLLAGWPARLERLGLRPPDEPTRWIRTRLEILPLEARLVPARTDVLVNTFTTEAQQTPAVASDAAGDFIVVWESYFQEASSVGVYGQLYRADGTRRGAAFRVLDTTTTIGFNPAVAMDADGDFVVVWEGGPVGSSGGVYAKRYASDGTAKGAAVPVNSSYPGEPGYAMHPAVGMDAVGNFVVAWEGFPLTPGWPTNYKQIAAHRYTSAGTAVGAEFLVNTVTTGYHIRPAVGMDAVGNFVVAWYDPNSPDGVTRIVARRYAWTGDPNDPGPVGGAFQVNTLAPGWPANPSVAMAPGGAFVVAWEGMDPETDEYPSDWGPDSGTTDAVSARRYAWTGDPDDPGAVGGQFRVNTYTTGSQDSPAVAVAADGSFVVAWLSYQDGSSSGVYGRRYTAAGSPVDAAEFQVNAYTTHGQSEAAAAAGASGAFVVAWAGEGPGDTDGVFIPGVNGVNWTAADATPQDRSGYGGLWGWSTPLDGLLYAGNVQVVRPLDLDLSPASCGCQDAALVYNSAEANPAPVVQAVVRGKPDTTGLPPGLVAVNTLGQPEQIYATLRWDAAGAVTTQVYDDSELGPAGQDWVVSIQPAAGQATGRHTYTLDLFVDYPGTADDVTLTFDGYTFVVNRDASPFGAGWSFSNTDQFFTVAAAGALPAGELRAFGRGGWAFYPAAGGGYASPPGDAGTLAAAGGGFTYTASDGKVLTFDAAGRMTGWADAAGTELFTYAYDGSGLLTTMAVPDGGVATFTYSSGVAQTVVAPGSRVTTLTLAGGDLTRVTDPGGGVHDYTYAGHKLTGETSGLLVQAFTYGAGGRVAGLAASTAGYGYGTLAVAPALTQQMTAPRPGAAWATATDGEGNETLVRYNWFGQRVTAVAADGGVWHTDRDGVAGFDPFLAQRSAPGYVTRTADPLGRETLYTRTASGLPDVVTQADGTTLDYDYGPDDRLTRFADALGRVTSYAYTGLGQLQSVTDALGGVTTYTYDATGRVATVTDALGRVTTAAYDAHRRLLGQLRDGAPTGTAAYDAYGEPGGWADPLGAVTTVVNDLMGRPVATTDPAGLVTTSVYDPGSGLLLSTTGPSGATTSYAYDASGRVTAVVEGYGSALARTTGYAYDGAGRLVAVTDPLGHTTTTAYDAVGRAVTTTDPLGHRTTTAYDPAGQARAVTDPLGRVTAYGYDLMGRVVAVTDPLLHVTTTVYDAAGNPTAAVDPAGRRTTTVYDALDRAVATVDALGNRATTVYDAVGHAVAGVDPLENRTTTVYDARDRVEATVDALGNRTSYAYDAADRVVAVTDPLGRTSTTVYDAAGRAVASVDPLLHATTTVYDAAGRVAATVDPNGNRTSYAYDALDRLVATIDALGNRTTTTYDAADRVTAVTDPLGHATGTEYDAANRVVASVDALGNRTTTVYDAADEVIASVDPNGNRTSYTYDAAGRVVAVIDALGNRTTTTYDAAGWAVAVTDPLLHTTTTVYDDAGRAVAAVDPLGNRTTTAYDAAGNAVATTDPLGRTATAVYDALNRVVATVDPLGHRATAVYDAAGQMTAGVDALGRRTTYAYDPAGRVEAVVDALGGRATSVYDAAGNVVAGVDPLGHRTTTAYDALNRAVAATDPLNATTTTAYDAAGRVTAVTDPLGRATAYEYDAADRLVAVVDPLLHRTTSGYDAAGNAVAVTDPLNHTTTTAYDALNRAVATVDALGNRATVVYDAAGRAVAAVDPLGRTGTTVYDAADRVVAAVDPLGNRSTVVYDAAGQAVASVDPLGHRTTAVYDAAGRQVATVDALTNRSTVAYDAVGNATATTDPLGRTTTVAYDALDRVVAVTDPLDHTTTTAYDAAGNAVSTTDPLNHTTTTVYDAADRAVATVDALGNRATVVYDAAGQTVASVDPLGRTTTTAYDAAGRVVAVTDPLLHTTTTAYDAAGNVAAVTDPLGHATGYAYDARNRVTAVTDALGGVATTVYDAAGQAVAAVDPRGNRTTFVYDAAGRREAVVDALGHRATAVYDAAGNAVAAVDPLGNRTTTAYDALGRAAAVTDPLGHTATTVYDAAGQAVAAVDPLGGRTTTGYDAAGRVVTVTDPLGGVTTYAYDAAGNRTALTDPAGNTTTWAYDALDRQVSETDPLGATATVAYDAAGYQTSRTDRLGRRVDTGYDAAGRKTSEAWYAAGTLVQTQTWSYDAAGNVLAAADPDGTYTLTYDALNRVVHAAEPFGLGLTFGYDPAGNRTRVEDSLGGVTTVTFDALNRQTVEEAGGAGLDRVKEVRAYDAAGRLATQTRMAWPANHLDWGVVGTTTHAYDAAGRETGVTHADPYGAALASYAYAYDAADRLVSQVENGAERTFAYDATDQLTAEPGATYAYDANGNRTSSGYATGPGNRLTTDGVWTYTYDAEGNVTKKSQGAGADTWVYTYDHDNRLLTAALSATDGGPATQRVTYAYDAWGDRISRAAWDGTTTTVERYGVDGWDPAKPPAVGTENVDTWAELDGSNALVTRRAWGPGVNDAILRATAGGAVTWLLADRQGSVRAATDAAGAVTGTVAYDAYGNVTAGALVDANGYAGYRYDGVTLLYSPGHGTREYDPATGTWRQVDPEGFAAGDANLTRYVGNGPTNATDPSGLDEVKFDGDDLLYTPQGRYARSNQNYKLASVNGRDDKGPYVVWEGGRIPVATLQEVARRYKIGDRGAFKSDAQDRFFGEEFWPAAKSQARTDRRVDALANHLLGVTLSVKEVPRGYTYAEALWAARVAAADAYLRAHPELFNDPTEQALRVLSGGDAMRAADLAAQIERRRALDRPQIYPLYTPEEAYSQNMLQNPELTCFGPDGLLWSTMPGNPLPGGGGRSSYGRSAPTGPRPRAGRLGGDPLPRDTFDLESVPRRGIPRFVFDPELGALVPPRVTPPPTGAPATPLARPGRLTEFYNRLRGQPASRTADEALGRVGRTLDEVEDALSGIPRKNPPPPPNMPDGRMYPPQADNIVRHADGSITARTRGHDISIGRDGSITMTNRETGKVDFHQPGAGN